MNDQFETDFEETIDETAADAADTPDTAETEDTRPAPRRLPAYVMHS